MTGAQEPRAVAVPSVFKRQRVVHKGTAESVKPPLNPRYFGSCGFSFLDSRQLSLRFVAPVRQLILSLI